MTSKTFTRWLKRVQDVATPWTENEIIYFRKAIGSSSTITDEQRQQLRAIFDGHEYDITPDQTTKGIEYLINSVWTKAMKPRRTAKAKVFGERERDIIANFYEFKFVGLQNVSQNSYRFYVPVYRVVAQDGSSFEYTTNMGHMEIVA